MKQLTKCIKTVLLIGLLCLLAGCHGTHPKIPGADVYYVSFKPDWKVFESGTYQYGQAQEAGFGTETRGEYNQFYPMRLHVKFKDGREFQESFDVEKLVNQLAETEEVFDTRMAKWGGAVYVTFYIKSNEINLVYEVWERIQKPPYFFSKKHNYPLLKKQLTIKPQQGE